MGEPLNPKGGCDAEPQVRLIIAHMFQCVNRARNGDVEKDLIIKDENHPDTFSWRKPRCSNDWLCAWLFPLSRLFFYSSRPNPPSPVAGSFRHNAMFGWNVPQRSFPRIMALYTT